MKNIERSKLYKGIGARGRNGDQSEEKGKNK